MTAFGRLWRRAPLWRTSLIIMVGGIGMASFFPTPALKKAMPRLPGHAPGASPSPAAGASSAQNAAGGNAPNGGVDQVGVPDPGITLRHSLKIAGRTVPLPTGDWHTILTARSGPHGEISQQVLARTDSGVVSAVIVVRASQQTLPQEVTDGLETPCHDDRNYASRISGKPGASEECTYMGNAVLANNTVSPDPFITAAFNRMATLGFPIPPLMINVGWYHAALQGTQGVQVETVETLIAPIEHGSRQLLAPINIWGKGTVHSNPDSSRFITDLDRWMLKWADVLRQGFDGTLDPNTLTPSITSDPSAPKAS